MSYVKVDMYILKMYIFQIVEKLQLTDFEKKTWHFPTEQKRLIKTSILVRIKLCMSQPEHNKKKSCLNQIVNIAEPQFPFSRCFTPAKIIIILSFI